MNNKGVHTAKGVSNRRVVNPKTMNPKELQRLIDDAWLDLDVNEEDLYNPLEIIPKAFDENPQIFLTWIMSHPYYLSIFCKEIMNVTIFPTQALILNELWNHRFPILLGSRGLAKTFSIALYSLLRAIFIPGRKIVVTGAAFRQSKLVMDYCETIYRNAPLLKDLVGNGKRDDQVFTHDSSEWVAKIGESRISAIPLGDGCQILTTQVLTSNGFRAFKDLFPENIETLFDKEEINILWGNDKFRESDAKHFNGLSKTKIIKTRKGYNVEATYNHKYKLVTENGIEWKRADEIQVGDYLLIDRTKRWHQGNFECTIDEAYALGAMIGDGCWTDKYALRFASMDNEIVDRIRRGGIPFKQSQTDKVHFSTTKEEHKNNFLNKWGLIKSYANNKILPNTILSAKKECMVACLQGLFDTDGTYQSSTRKGGTSLTISYCSISERLINQIQFILLHFGILSYVCYRDRERNGNKCQRAYELIITGKDAIIFANEINFYLPRKKDKVNEAVQNKKRNFSTTDYVPFTKSKILELRKLFKSKEIRLASHLNQLQNIGFVLGNKIINEAKLNEVKYEHIDLLTEIFNENYFYDKVQTIEESEALTYDIHIPEGHEYCANGLFSHNTTVRGKRSNDTVAEEFASINRHVFENVIGGFSVVNQNPVDKLRKAASDKKRIELGVEIETDNNSSTVENQTLISGTAYYQFNHFYEYFKKHREIIRSMGNTEKLRSVVGDEVENPAFNWKDYCIIRIPFDMMPMGYFDAAQISRSKVNTLASNFLAEYGACFPSDSEGFFRRTLIERCVPNDSNIIRVNNTIIDFVPNLTGNSQSRFVLAIDPASENDNCAIVIIELRDDHRRIVYCWTTNKKLHRANLVVRRTQEDNYWAFVVRKIRDLMKRFPTCAIAIDSQGGGNSIMEGLHDKDKMEHNEVPIWPIFGQAKHEWCDTQEGSHMIHMLHFASNEWLGNAYFNTKKDMEEQLLLFPSFDGATMGLTDCIENTKFVEGGLDESMENLIDEIEELKNELTCIIHTKTPTGKDQFTVPDIKTAEGKKSKVKKDRASALIMANSVARSIMRDFIDSNYESNGGFASPLKDLKGAMYSNPWYSNAVNDAYDGY